MRQLSAETLGEPVNTVTYSYTDANFKKAVTQYGDDAIVYDASGNPTIYRDYTMTWAKGRQLASLAGNRKSMSFKYDRQCRYCRLMESRFESPAVIN